ncbi:MAG: MraZ N-terminal domain containing protein, partial [Rhodobacteraceae bacterium]|nr:MraZ N-terminal domain containing protein [Paracoccaceae bacterium]
MGTVFRGEFCHNIDAKKRIAVPADFRRAIGEEQTPETPRGLDETPRLTIVYGDDRLECLQCYSEQTIRKIDDAIARLGRATDERKF